MPTEINTPTEIAISAFGSLITIVFRNTSINAVDAFVCTNREVAARERARLESMAHIEIITVTNAQVQY